MIAGHDLELSDLASRAEAIKTNLFNTLFSLKRFNYDLASAHYVDAKRGVKELKELMDELDRKLELSK